MKRKNNREPVCLNNWLVMVGMTGSRTTLLDPREVDQIGLFAPNSARNPMGEQTRCQILIKRRKSAFVEV